MITTSQESGRSTLANEATRETVVGLTGLGVLHDPLTAARKTRDNDRAWNCLEHLPGSIASFAAEYLRFGGGRRRQEAATAAYDAIWAGHGVGGRGGGR